MASQKAATHRTFPIRAAPYQHQRKAAAFALERLESGGGAALLMEMGTGKTLTTIAIVGSLWLQRKIQHLLVVAPLSILGVWRTSLNASPPSATTSLCSLAAARARPTHPPHERGRLQVLVVIMNLRGAWRRSWPHGSRTALSATRATRSRPTTSPRAGRCTGWARRRNTACCSPARSLPTSPSMYSASTNSLTLRSTATVSTCSATATSTWWAMATTRR